MRYDNAWGGVDDSDPAPYLLMAKLYEGQRTFMRAVEAYRNAATRTASARPNP